MVHNKFLTELLMAQLLRAEISLPRFQNITSGVTGGSTLPVDFDKPVHQKVTKCYTLREKQFFRMSFFGFVFVIFNSVQNSW
jgi:hypothetical protein